MATQLSAKMQEVVNMLDWTPSEELVKELMLLPELPLEWKPGPYGAAHQWHHQGRYRPTRALSDKEVASIVRDAAKALSGNGWVQGIMRSDTGTMCTLGAIDHVLIPTVRYNGARQRQIGRIANQLSLWLKENFPFEGVFASRPVPVGVDTWNDHCVSSGDEVCQWLHKFADAIDPPGRV